MYIRYKHIAYLLLTAVLMTACNEHETGIVTEDEVTFAAEVNRYATRLSQDGSQWTEGDQIGVYSFTSGATTTMHFSNVAYTAATTAATTIFNPVNDAITYPKDGKAVDFIAYYPYLSTMNDDLYPINLSHQAASLVAHDLLYARSNNGGSGHTAGTVSLGFTHQLTKIIINLSRQRNRCHTYTRCRWHDHQRNEYHCQLQPQNRSVERSDNLYGHHPLHEWQQYRSHSTAVYRERQTCGSNNGRGQQILVDYERQV